MLGSVTPTLGALTDYEIEQLVQDLGASPHVAPEDMSPIECEAVTRAYVMLAAHLIHRPRFAERRELPASVALPLWQLSAFVGRPPSLTYASYVLANSVTSIRPRMPTTELKIAQTPSGTTDEEWFVAVHLSVESIGGEVVKAIDTLEKALDCDDEELVINALQSIQSSLVFAKSIMPTVLEGVNPEIFRNQIRPLLYGHDRIVFRGVSGEPVITYIGETGAQSGVIRAADAVLGIPHSDGITASMNRFLSCAPPTHRKFFGKATSLGQSLVSRLGQKAVREIWRSAVETLAEFRGTHFEVVNHYLAPTGKSLAERGTGGTDFQVWLKRLVNETKDAATFSATKVSTARAVAKR